MINHIRTLLLNSSIAEARALTFPGEDIVPLSYRPVILSDPLLSVYRTLFGSNPDRAYKNWRLREYMTTLHNSKLADHLTVSDKRITYWPYDRPLGFDSDPLLGANVSRVYGNMAMEVIGDPVADDANGRLLWTGNLDIENGTDYRIACETPRRLESTGVLTFTSGLSAPIAVPGTNVKFVLAQTASTSDRFLITLMARPGKGISDVMIDLESMIGRRATGRAATALFGSGSTEPYKTYRNLWLDGVPTLRLGAVLLALAKRIEEI